jgi:hypothetical protein
VRVGSNEVPEASRQTRLFRGPVRVTVRLVRMLVVRFDHPLTLPSKRERDLCAVRGSRRTAQI